MKITVIGTVFIDCKGFASHEYHPLGRNLGSIEFVHGGVGRNVAENLARLQLPVTFLTTRDNSGIGDEVITRLQQAEVDTEFCVAAEKGMGMWLAIMDQSGNLAGSISQMPDLGSLENIINSNAYEIINQSSHVVLELDLTDEITATVIRLAKILNKPIYGLPGNLDVVMRNMGLLSHLDCFICNHIEAERLSGVSYDGLCVSGQIETLKRFVDEKGLRSMVVTLASDGAVFYDSLKNIAGHQPVFPVNLIDSAGAGDAFFSGTTMALIQGLPLDQAVIAGTKTAGWTIGSKENASPTLGDIWHKDEWFQRLMQMTGLPHHGNASKAHNILVHRNAGAT